jgi:hypothetical protein
MFRKNPIKFESFLSELSIWTGEHRWTALPTGQLSSVYTYPLDKEQLGVRFVDRDRMMQDLADIMGATLGTYSVKQDLSRGRADTKNGPVSHFIGTLAVNGQEVFGTTIEGTFVGKLMFDFKVSPRVNTAIVGRVATVSNQELFWKAAAYIESKVKTSDLVVKSDWIRWSTIQIVPEAIEGFEEYYSVKQRTEAADRLVIPTYAVVFQKSDVLHGVTLDRRDGSIMTFSERRLISTLGQNDLKKDGDTVFVTPVQGPGGMSGTLISARKGNYHSDQWLRLGNFLVKGKIDKSQMLWRGNLSTGREIYVKLKAK